MTITDEHRGDVTILRIHGMFMGEPDSVLFHAKKYELVEAKRFKLVLDLSNMNMINSSGLGSLIAGLLTARNHAGDLRLAAMTKQVASVIEKVNLNQIFQVFAKVDDAVTSFKAK